MRFVILTGMSGAGKSTALKMMEDIGYYCVDNLPIPLIEKFAELAYESSAELEKVALASMAVAVGVGLWGGLSSFLNDSNSGMLIWGLCLSFCAVGVTFSLRKMMRQPISLADQDEANEVMRDRWIVPLISLCINVIGSIVFVAFRLFC